MKLLAVLLLSILAYASSETEYIEFELYHILDTYNNEWIPIKMSKNGTHTEVNVLQEIIGDDWMVDFEIVIDSKPLPDFITPLCGPAETSQEDNIIQLLKKALGLDNQSCPIQPQSITNPEKIFKGNFEVDNYNKIHRIRVTMTLIKDYQPVLRLTILNKQ